MAIIRRLTLSDIIKLQKMVNYVNFDNSHNLFAEKNFTPFPFDVLHDLLPIQFRFLQESFVAVEDSEILGLICVAPDRGSKSRWKINHLVLNTNAFDAGKMLIDYVVNKFGSAGAVVFVTHIDNRYDEALSLFRMACSFRHVSQIQTWVAENLSEFAQTYDFTGFREVKPDDAPKIQAFYQQSLYSLVRLTLAKDVSDFNSNSFTKFKSSYNKTYTKKYLLEEPKAGAVEGYFSMSSEGGDVFRVDANLSMPYAERLQDIVYFAVENISKVNQNGILKVNVRKYFQGGDNMIDVLQKMGLKCESVSEVLVKDYWRPVKSESAERKFVIFTDRTSAASYWGE